MQDPKQELLDFRSAVERQEERVEEVKEDLKAVLESFCITHDLNDKAFQAARKLDDMKPHQRNSWLRTFDLCREAFGMNDQKTLEVLWERRAEDRATIDELRELNEGRTEEDDRILEEQYINSGISIKATRKRPSQQPN